MGEIAFGRSFDMLKNGQSHFALDLLAEGMKPLGLFGPVPWMFNILSSIPGLGAGLAVFVSWCGDQVEQRKKVGFPSFVSHGDCTSSNICAD